MMRWFALGAFALAAWDLLVSRILGFAFLNPTPTQGRVIALTLLGVLLPLNVLLGVAVHRHRRTGKLPHTGGSQGWPRKRRRGAGFSTGGPLFYHQDALGSMTSLSDSSQSLESTYRYDAFGVQTQASGNQSNTYRYTGRAWDDADALNYHGARYYDPTIGRFLSQDPSGVEDGTNLYTYTGNNPVNFRDPSGYRREPDQDSTPADNSASLWNYITTTSEMPPTGGRDVVGGTTGGVDWGAWAQKCSVPWALFSVGIIATALGLYFTEHPLENMALQLIMRYDTQMIAFAAAMMGFAGTARSGIEATTMLGLARVMLNFMWIVAVNVIAPELGWFGAMEVTAGIITLAAPGAGQVRMAIIATSIILGLIGPMASGCIVPGVSL